MPDLNVFISSTYEDLKPYREKIIDFFKDGLPNIAFRGMETMPASDMRPIDMCRRKVEESNVFILVIGKRYGWIPGGPEHAALNPNAVSITELEYRWVKNHYRGKTNNTILCFLADGSTPLATDADAEPAVRETKAAKLKAFVQTVMGDDQIVKRFITPDDLVKQINHALFDKYTRIAPEKTIEESKLLCCNRSTNYRLFKTSPRWNGTFNLFLAVGTREDLLENFFQRIVLFEYHARVEDLKALPQKPTSMDRDKCLREHIAQIAFEIDPTRSSDNIATAIERYGGQRGGNIYFKTDVSMLEVEELQDYMAYLKELFTQIQAQADKVSGVQLLLFIYTNCENLHYQLAFEGCNDLGEFGEIGQQDIKTWLGDVNITQDGDVQEEIIGKYVLNSGDSLYHFQYTMKQTRSKLKELIRLYNEKDPDMVNLIN
jgi:Domain of unknown function (DUF4062)